MNSRKTLTKRITGLLLLTLSSAGWGAGVGIIQPGDGTELLSTSAFYDPVDETVRVNGHVTDLKPGTLADYQVLINGFAVSIAGGGGGTASFSASVAIGPTPPPGMASWPDWVPYVNQFVDIEAILLPVLAELYHVPSRTVVSRHRVTMVDKRWDPDMDMHAQGALGDNGAFELTELGIEALQSTHESTLPLPSLAEFNADLTDAFAGTPGAVPTDTSFGSSTKACTGVESEPMLTATDAYGAASDKARTQLELYRAAEDACDNGNLTELVNLIPGWGQLASGIVRAMACVTKNSSCVREAPREDRFEVCVGEVEGVGNELSLAGVRSVDLALADSASIDVRNILERLDGTVDVTLKDLFIRWDVEHAGCTVRPEAPMDDGDRLAVSAVAAWSSCPLLQADALSASMPLAQRHPVAPAAAHPEQLEVTAGAAPDPLFELFPSDPETVLGSGTCSEPWISADVETLLNDFYEPMREDLDSTWDAGNPATQQAEALDLLLSRFETGVFEAMSDVELDLEIARIDSGEDRLRGHYDSRARLLPDLPAFAVPEFVHAPRSDFPCEGGAFALSNSCSESRDFFGNAFDVSYSLTTGTLNQVIGERYVTERLFRRLTPSCEDLNLAPNCAPDDRPALDGATLGSLHASLADFGSTQVAIELRPTRVPFTWIHPDPPNPPGAGRGDLTYQLGQYEVDFIGDSAGPDGTTLWLRVIVDFFAPAVDLEVARSASRNEIVAALGDELVWHYTIVKSQLGGCPLVPHTHLPAGQVPPPCEGELTEAVAGLVEPVLEDALHGMLTGHPAPQLFDASGEAQDDRRFSQTDRYQWGQVITLYGELAD